MDDPDPIATSAPSFDPRPLEDTHGYPLLGAALLALAGYFVWHDLRIDGEYLLLGAALLSLAAQLLRRPRFWPELGLGGLVGCAVIAGGWFVCGDLWSTVSTSPPHLMLLLGVLGIAFAGCVAALAQLYLRHEPAPWPARVVFPSVLVGLVASAVAYYGLFTLGVAAEHVGRRLILTLVWLVVGLGLDFFGHERRDRTLARGGLIIVSCAVGKAILYDVSHLDGGWRIAVLGCAGLLLVGSAALRQWSRAQERGRA